MTVPKMIRTALKPVPPIDYVMVGAFMRRAREEANVSIRALAKLIELPHGPGNHGKIGCSAVYLSDLERGRSNWSLALVDAYYAALQRAKQRKRLPAGKARLTARGN